jgi:multicomponent Na+:H+ antiporter subunit B
VSRRVRSGLFLVAAPVFGLLLVWGLLGLPTFGDYRGPYGDLLQQVALPERHTPQVVGATTFDYRGFDTLGEEYILFAAALGAVILLRQQRGEERDEEEEQDHPADRQRRDTSEALRLLGLGLVGPLVVLGIYVIVHGHLTPGGGFQGGVVLASAFVLVHVAGRYLTLKRVRPMPLVEVAEAGGAAGFVLMGLGGIIAGSTFLFNFLPLGEPGTLLSAGMIPLLNLSVGLEVAGAVVLLFSEFVEQWLLKGRGGGA